MQPIGIDLYEPSLGSHARTLSEGELRDLSTRLAEFVVRDAKETGPEVEDALAMCHSQRFGESSARSALATLAQEAELSSLQLEHEWERSRVPERTFVDAFLRARALLALLNALDENAVSSALWTLNEVYQYLEESPRWESDSLASMVYGPTR